MSHWDQLLCSLNNSRGIDWIVFAVYEKKLIVKYNSPSQRFVEREDKSQYFVRCVWYTGCVEDWYMIHILRWEILLRWNICCGIADWYLLLAAWGYCVGFEDWYCVGIEDCVYANIYQSAWYIAWSLLKTTACLKLRWRLNWRRTLRFDIKTVSDNILVIALIYTGDCAAWILHSTVQCILLECWNCCELNPNFFADRWFRAL